MDLLRFLYRSRLLIVLLTAIVLVELYLQTALPAYVSNQQAREARWLATYAAPNKEFEAKILQQRTEIERQTAIYAELFRRSEATVKRNEAQIAQQKALIAKSIADNAERRQEAEAKLANVQAHKLISEAGIATEQARNVPVYEAARAMVAQAEAEIKKYEQMIETVRAQLSARRAKAEAAPITPTRPKHAMRQPAFFLLAALLAAEPVTADDLSDCQNDALEPDKRTAACTRVTEASDKRIENAQLVTKCVAEAWGLDPANSLLEASCDAALKRNPTASNYLNRAAVHNRLGNIDRGIADLAIYKQLKGESPVGPPPTTASTSPVVPPAQTPAPQAPQPSTRPGWIGVIAKSLWQNDATHIGLASNAGARIVHIIDGTPAHLSGLELNDIVLEINGQTVADLDTFVSNVSALPPGDPAIFTIYRKHKRYIAVQIAAKPEIDPRSVPPIPRSISMSIRCQDYYATWKTRWKLNRTGSNRTGHGAFAAGDDGGCGDTGDWPDLAGARQRAMYRCPTKSKTPCEIIDEY